MLRGSSKKGTSASADSAPSVGGVSSFAEDDKKAPKSKLKLIVILLILAALLGGAYFFFSGPPPRGPPGEPDRPGRERDEYQAPPRERVDIENDARDRERIAANREDEGTPQRRVRERPQTNRRRITRQRGVLHSIALDLCMDQTQPGNLVECHAGKPFTYHLNTVILFDRKLCLEVHSIGENQGHLQTGRCIRDQANQHWRYNPLTGQLMHSNGGCLSVVSHNVNAVLPGSNDSPPSVLVSKCSEESRLQIWDFGQRRPREPLEPRPPRPNRGRPEPPPRRERAVPPKRPTRRRGH